ncbi:ABC transporter permease [Vallitalea guaymasensis]|uniref:ABC transporter permease n=1 Tax=Vallitalea guaymasensis TaxID=1185412 RepID=A0A8J8SDZ1_9FIRM|nr:ABC transporter permease [Vallitalea guaymasensis]QUH31312.1 ABC transporter permease [Vallitalea guaymasensis]
MNRLFNILQSRLKLLFKSKMIIILLIIMISLFGMLVGTLYHNADESSSIPVAVVDKDGTDMSKNILDNLDDDKTLRVFHSTETEAMGKLKDGQIEAVYILKKGLKDNIINEKYDEIIDVYYIRGSNVAKFVGDIFAEKVLRDLCLTKSINLLERALEENDYDDKDSILREAYEYGISMQDYSNDKHYYINVEFVDSDKSSIDANTLDNDLIYKKMILGIIISFTSFFLLFASISIVKDKENGMLGKIQITSTNNATIILGNYLSLVVSGSIIGMIFSIINSVYAADNHLKIFFGTFIALLMFVISISSLIMFFTSVIDKTSTFTMIFTIFILIMGIVSGSFFSIDLLTGGIKSLSYLIPNYWTLNYLTDIITKGFDSIDLLKYMGIMLVYTVIMILITYSINKYRRKVIR